MGLAFMTRNPDQLIRLSLLCRDLAGTCQTDEARDALLEVAADLETEADGKPSSPDASLFNWQDGPPNNWQS
jgi:hypothetical protein